MQVENRLASAQSGAAAHFASQIDYKTGHKLCVAPLTTPRASNGNWAGVYHGVAEAPMYLCLAHAHAMRNSRAAPRKAP